MREVLAGGVAAVAVYLLIMAPWLLLLAVVALIVWEVWRQ